MNESYIVQSIRKMIKAEFPDMVWFYKASDMNTAGIPDIIGCLSGRFFAIEVKMPNGRISDLQRYTLVKIQNAGGAVFVAKCVQDARDFLTRVKKGEL